MTQEKIEFIKKVASILATHFHFGDEVSIFVGCQFALESDFGLSKLALEKKNFCGMRNPIVRISVAKQAGDSNFHWAQYNSIEDCILDYVLCFQYHRPMSVDYRVLKFFKSFIKWYCPERDYIKRIDSIYNQFINS